MEHLHLFGSGTYSANGLAAAAALSAIAVIILGTVVWIRARDSAAGVLFFAITAAASGWLGSFAMMYASHNADVALVWARAANFAAALIAPAVFHFAAVYIGRAHALRHLIAISWAVCGVIGVLSTTSALIPAVHHFAWGFYPAPTLLLLPAFIVDLLLLAASVRFLWIAYQTSEGRARERASMLIVAFALGALSMTDYLPSLGIGVGPIGHIAMLAFAIVAATAIWRHQLADVTPEYAAGTILETMKNAVLVVDRSAVIGCPAVIVVVDHLCFVKWEIALWRSGYSRGQVQMIGIEATLRSHRCLP